MGLRTQIRDTTETVNTRVNVATIAVIIAATVFVIAAVTVTLTIAVASEKE